MILDEIRLVWIRQAESMSAEVIKRYHAQRIGSGGREGLGVYGIYQERIARKKVQIAVKLLVKNGLEPITSNIHKITKKSRSTIQRYMPPQVLKKQKHESPTNVPDNHMAQVIPLRPS